MNRETMKKIIVLVAIVAAVLVGLKMLNGSKASVPATPPTS